MNIDANTQTIYQTALTQWRAATDGFADWQLAGTRLLEHGGLALDLLNAAEERDPFGPGGYHGQQFYNGGAYWVGEATSPEVPVLFAFKEGVASWNGSVPQGTWMETLVRIRCNMRWSGWYHLGVWSSGGPVARHSVPDQADEDAYVADDTLVIKNPGAGGGAYQVKLRLFSENRTAVPQVRNAAMVVSGEIQPPDSLKAGDPGLWGRVLDVPQCSQMVYPDGGNVWCSPTSISMILRYWGKSGTCAERVRQSVAGTFDWQLDGYGNWSFNTAYASMFDLDGYVMRFTSLAEAEPWIASGVPVVVSFRWQKGTLSGAPVESSNGHLAVLVGFDGAGNPVINDPAAPVDEEVRRTYQRSEWEPLWLGGSGGTVYLIFPQGWKIPD